MKSKIIITAFLSILLFCCKKDSKSSDNNKFVDDLIIKTGNEFLKDKRFKSVSIGIYYNGRIFKNHFGELDLNKKNTPSDSTVYEIASVTKTMTGFLTAKAVKEGKLNLETEISDFITSKDDNLRGMKIKHLLSHTSGLPSNAPRVDELYDSNWTDSTFYKSIAYEKQYTVKSFLNSLKIDSLSFKPGEKYMYSNIAPNLMAYILEKTYNQTYDQLVKEHLFEPLKMKNTYIGASSSDKHLANGYNEKNVLQPHFSKFLYGAHGNCKSSFADLVKYMKSNLEEELIEFKIVKSDVFKHSSNFSSGYFWLKEKKEKFKDETIEMIYHNGTAPGTITWLCMFPEQRLGIVLVTNVSFQEGYTLAWQTVEGLWDELKPEGIKSIRHRIQALSFEDVDEALALYDDLKKTSPNEFKFDEPSEFYFLGQNLLNRNKAKSAIKVLEKSIALFPNESYLYNSLGNAYYKNKNLTKAKSIFNKSIELDSKDYQAIKMLKKIESE